MVVSGGASGLGAAVVEAVQKAGGRPFVLDRVPVDGVPHVVVDLAGTREAERAARELAVRSGGLDGVVTAAGTALRGLRAARPTEESVLAAPAGLEPLARLTGAVDRVLPVDGLAVPGIAVPPPRLAVNLHGKGPRSHRLLLGTRPERLLAFACVSAGFPDGPQWTVDEHALARGQGRRACRPAPRRVLAGHTDVGGLAALVAHARLVVSGDTGIAHLATGYQTPSVLLFGPTPPEWWGPVLDQDLHRVLWHGERPAPPLRRAGTARGWRRPHPALAAITVDEVMAAVEGLALKRTDAAAPRRPVRACRPAAAPRR